MPIYISSQTLKFDRISDLPLSDPDLIEVPTMPPGINYRYEAGEWIALTGQFETPQVPPPDRIFGIVDLTKPEDLDISNDVFRYQSKDVLYYKSVAPKFNEKGAYLTSRGYLIFPQLKILEGEDRTISFVFFAGNDARYLAFGFIDAKNYNFNSADYGNTELSLRFRNQRGCYYQYGRYASGRNGLSFMGYEAYDRESFYRLDLPTAKNAEKAQFYRLSGGEPDKWFGGELKQEINLTQAPDRTGKILYPFFGDTNGEFSPLTGVFLR